jgi:hypothetical protein
MTYHLAQINIGKFRYPTDDPRMEGFMSQLETINKLAENTPGFIWRLQDESGNATAIRPFPEDMLAINFSIWKDIESLHQYTYFSDHAKIFKDRKQWFEVMQEAYMVLWWIPEGHTPSLQEAKERLDALRKDGPTAYAFTFKQRFKPPV